MLFTGLNPTSMATKSQSREERIDKHNPIVVKNAILRGCHPTISLSTIITGNILFSVVFISQNGASSEPIEEKSLSSVVHFLLFGSCVWLSQRHKMTSSCLKADSFSFVRYLNSLFSSVSNLLTL